MDFWYDKKELFDFCLFRRVRKHFGSFYVFCTINCYFGCVSQILCIFLCIGSYFKDIFEHFSKNVTEVWTILVQTIYFLKFIWILVLNGPTSCSIRRVGRRWSLCSDGWSEDSATTQLRCGDLSLRMGPPGRKHASWNMKRNMGWSFNMKL